MKNPFSLILNNEFKLLYNLIEKNSESFKNKTDIKGRTLLHYATSSGNINILDYLLKKGFSPNIKCHSGETPLFDVTRRGNIEIAKLLIQNGASIKIINNKGENIIHLAFFKGDEKYIKLLEENGANFELLTNYDQNIIHYAIMGGRYDIVKKILKEKKIDINHLDKGGNSYLHYLTKDSNIELIDYFLKKGLDINLLNYVFETPIFNATRNNDIDLVKHLIKKGAYTSIINKDFKTISDISYINDLSTINYYLENYHETLDYKLKEKEDALIIAVLNRDYWEIKKILLTNYNIDHKNIFNKDALYYAKKYRFKMSEDLILNSVNK